jgi:ferredoxin, 2Fe-2S
VPRVTFLLGDEIRSVEFEAGSLPYSRHGLPGSILDVALNFDIHLPHACGGSCACTTCHVIVRKGSENLNEMTEAEADRLDTAWGLTPHSRLACQALVAGDVVCEVPRYSRNLVTEGRGLNLGPRPPENQEG